MDRALRAAVPALALLAAAACSDATTARGGRIEITASGETLGLQGLTYPPSSSEEPFFVDGWTVRFSKLLVTFDDVVVARGPDTDPADVSRVGAVVARAKGPWAVDLQKGGPLTGRGGEGQAVALTTLDRQTENGGAPFAADEKYAVGFDVVAASDAAKRVNVDAADPDYAEMIQRKQTVLYVGTATFTGGTDCTPAIDPVLDALPTTVAFRLGFASPVSYVNCQNPDLGGETRGLFVKENEAVVAQLTLHADHPFWGANEEDAPLRFDAFALAAQKKGGGAPVTMDDLAVAFAPVSFGGTELPARTCKPSGPPPAGAYTYDAKGARFADLRALLSELQVAQGHLNGSGLCGVKAR